MNLLVKDADVSFTLTTLLYEDKLKGAVYTAPFNLLNYKLLSAAILSTIAFLSSPIAAINLVGINPFL